MHQAVRICQSEHTDSITSCELLYLMISSFCNKCCNCPCQLQLHRVIEIHFSFLLLIQNGALSSLPSPVCSPYMYYGYLQQERPLEEHSCTYTRALVIHQ